MGRCHRWQNGTGPISGVTACNLNDLDDERAPCFRLATGSRARGDFPGHINKSARFADKPRRQRDWPTLDAGGTAVELPA
jgi:hypothetical protein